MILVSLLSASLLAMPANNDWQPGDPYFPSPDQLPDEPTWIPLDDLGLATKGLPPTIEVTGIGNQARDSFSITLHGFWVEPFHHADDQAHERFLTFRIPGMTNRRDLGMPALPKAMFLWGLGTDSQQLDLESLDEADIVFFDDARVAPFQGLVLETAQGADLPPFTIDEAFYNGGPGQPWPQDAADVRTGPNLDYGGLPLGRAEFAPIRFDPFSNRIQVVRRMEGTIARPGDPIRDVHLGRSWFSAARSLLANLDWLVWEGIIQNQPPYWSGRYLIVHPAGWLDELEPLITLKQQRGYQVDRISIESIPSGDVEDFHAAIETWYQASNVSDRYVLLVGDSNRIPHHETTFWGGASDALYAFMDENDSPDLWLGRFPASTAQECAFMVEKAVRYQTANGFDRDFYETGTLAAHSGEADAYLDCIDSIIAASSAYDVPRTFIDRGGDTTSGEESLVIADMEVDHVGLVLYRGHGSIKEWWEWDFYGASTDASDTASLQSALYNPVVYNISCLNHGIQYDPLALGRDWLGNSGASASVGAHEISYRSANSTFAENVMELLHGSEVHTIGSATMTALYDTMIEFGESYDSRWNQQVYSIFGDPDQVVRNRYPINLTIGGFGELQLGMAVHTDVPVLDEQGNPLADVLVTLSGANGPLVTALTDENGMARIPAILDLVPTPEDDKYVLRAWSDNRNAFDFVGYVPVDGAEEVFGDLDGDGDVDGADLAVLLGAWGEQNSIADLDGDGKVDGADLALLLGAWRS